MKIEYRGNLTADGKPHKGVYIASGKGGFQHMFKPGVNAISAKDFEKVQDCKGLVRRLENGELIIRHDDRTKKAKEGAASEKFATGADLPELPQAEAIKLVKSTIDVDILRGWLADEKKEKGQRHPVVKALKEQIDACTTDAEGNPAEPRKVEFSGPRPEREAD